MKMLSDKGARNSYHCHTLRSADLPMLLWFVDIFDAPTVEDMVFLTINQRSGRTRRASWGSIRGGAPCVRLMSISNRAQTSQMRKQRS